MKKILIADDEKDIRELLKKRLIQEGYEVITASSGQEAFSICKTSHPDLLLLDIAIPQMDGYDTCRNIKQDSETRDISILFMTGKELEPGSVIQRCKDLGVSGYISKPCSMQELLEKIRAILGS